MEYIIQPSKEELVMLDLLIDALFDKYSVDPEKVIGDNGTQDLSWLEETGDSDYCDGLIGDYEDERENNKKYTIRKKEVKRLTVTYNSKLRNRAGSVIKDDDLSYEDSMCIEWDHYTNIFKISLHRSPYDPQSNNSRHNRLYGLKDTFDANGYGSMRISINFKYKYRHEIIMMKAKLIKLYKLSRRDKAQERMNEARRNLATAASTIFPSLVDPLILGGNSYEIKNRDVK